MSKIVIPDVEKRRPKKKWSPVALASLQKPVGAGLSIRPVRRVDLDAVIEIDAMVTGIEKIDYWNSLYRRYADAVATGQHFLVAVAADEVIGFVIGEVRDHRCPS